MKFFSVVAWICGIAAAVIMITGSISLISGQTFFNLRHVVNYFHVSNSLLLLGILCLMARQGCIQNKTQA